ncbi:D-amino-acid dehydrogenase [Bradyrhizobium sp. S3.3.6]|nr:FAD-binding oxidoreductase [Bradyrhizobium rifense]
MAVRLMHQSERHVVVIGAGIVGAATAIELLREGHQVTILEPGEIGGDHAASYGNGGWISRSLVVPTSVPGLWRHVPGYLMDPLGPLTIHWRYLPGLLPWLWRFLHSGSTIERVGRTAAAISGLISDCAERHRKLAQEADVPDLLQDTSLLHVFRKRSDFDANALAWRLRQQNGTTWRELDQGQLSSLEPDLDPRYTFAIAVDGSVCVDPGRYVAALVDHACRRGATIRKGRARGFRIKSGRLQAVQTADGELACDRGVIATGAWSKELVRGLGDRVFLESERGYHAVIQDPEIKLKSRILFTDGKLAITTTPSGLRVTGQVELASLRAKPNWTRAHVLRDFALNAFPGMPKTLPHTRQTFWMGHRPSTPDGIPVIGSASKCADVIYAFGHGHIGMTAAPVTGRIVAEIISEKTPCIDPGPFSARRFGGGAHPQ